MSSEVAAPNTAASGRTAGNSASLRGHEWVHNLHTPTRYVPKWMIVIVWLCDAMLCDVQWQNIELEGWRMGYICIRSRINRIRCVVFTRKYELGSICSRVRCIPYVYVCAVYGYLSMLFATIVLIWVIRSKNEPQQPTSDCILTEIKWMHSAFLSSDLSCRLTDWQQTHQHTDTHPHTTRLLCLAISHFSYQ